MAIEAVRVDALADPPEPYSHAIRAGNTLYLAGQVAFDREGRIVGDTVTEQARQIWQNITDILEAAGSSVADIVKVTYIMADIREITEEFPIREEVFAGRPPPAVTAMQAAALGLPGLRMEVDVIAVVSDD